LSFSHNWMLMFKVLPVGMPRNVIFCSAILPCCILELNHLEDNLTLEHVASFFAWLLPKKSSLFTTSQCMPCMSVDVCICKQIVACAYCFWYSLCCTVHRFDHLMDLFHKWDIQQNFLKYAFFLFHQFQGFWSIKLLPCLIY